MVKNPEQKISESHDPTTKTTLQTLYVDGGFAQEWRNYTRNKNKKVAKVIHFFKI